jgi:hypothetical protein
MKFCSAAAAGIAVLMMVGCQQVRPVTPAEVKASGWDLQVRQQTFHIDPPALKSLTFDCELKDGEPGWRGPTLLPGPAWAYGALHVDTLVVTRADDPKTRLELGKDFALDPKWAAIAAIKGSTFPAGTKVHCAYKYGMSRIDLLSSNAGGKLMLTKGVEDKAMPLLPATPKGQTPVLSVYLPNGARGVTQDDLNFIDPTYDGIPPVFRRETLDSIREKLHTGKPVTIAFLGDSITAMPAKDFKDGKGSFIDRFAADIKASYPGSDVVTIERGKPVPAPKDHQVLIVKAGVGGDDTPRALKRLDKDVLEHKPDAVVVMLGVNDENRKDGGNGVPPEAYKKNLDEIARKIQASGSLVVFMTPSMKNLNWDGTVGNMAEYAKAMREVAQAHNACLVDNYRAWELLPKRGYNYMVFLGNCINHPVDLGHDLMFRGLKAAFQ